MTTPVITESTVAGLFADGGLTPAEFGLTVIEFRRHGRCAPTEFSPCNHGDDSCTMVQDVYRADNTASKGDPHCDLCCPNLEEDEALFEGIGFEGIGGEYAGGGTFSYITDDRDLANRVYARAAEVIG